MSNGYYAGPTVGPDRMTTKQRALKGIPEHLQTTVITVTAVIPFIFQRLIVDSSVDSSMTEIWPGVTAGVTVINELLSTLSHCSIKGMTAVTVMTVVCRCSGIPCNTRGLGRDRPVHDSVYVGQHAHAYDVIYKWAMAQRVAKEGSNGHGLHPAR
jgi:hypothetical protein